MKKTAISTQLKIPDATSFPITQAEGVNRQAEGLSNYDTELIYELHSKHKAKQMSDSERLSD